MTLKQVLTASLAFFLAGPALSGEALESAAATFRELPREVRLDGVVEAVNQSTISSQTRGLVEEILFDVDDFVKKGDLIIRLRDTEPRARLSQAEAELKSAEASLKEATDDHQRTKEVFGRKLVAESELDRAASALSSARARRDAATAALNQAKEQLDYTLVRAPYSGIVTHRLVQIGEIANPGQALMTGVSLDKLRVVVDVPQSLIPAVREQGAARVQQPGDGWLPVSKLTIFPFAQSGSNTFRVRLDLPEGVGDMVPGMYVKTAFVLGSRKELVIPQQAVVHRSEVTGAYVVSAEGKVSLRHLRTGETALAGQVSVLAGLEEGEQVALDPVAAGALLKQQMEGRRHE